LVDTALQAFGRLDGLVHAAGVSVEAVGDILEVTPEAYERCLAVNARAGFFLMQRVARQLVATPAGAQPRFLVVVTSSNATALSIDRSEYCVSKAALSMATQCFAARLAPHGIQVFEIRPGVIATAMTAPRLARYEQRIREQDLTVVPRVGQPEEVAAWVAALALDGLPYTVGQVVSVDGGLTSRRY
jgi:NAD(P)-dependent dehydrogenase (short-subunit alcohol dehydrogenase family)